MAVKYQAYSEYKDSGVEWLGDAPEGWDIKKLKFACELYSESFNFRNFIDAVG